MANELWIYDVIGEDVFTGGITPDQVRDELAEMDRKQPLLVRINSPGGDVFDAIAIASLLSEWPHQVDTQVDGLAASAASVIAMYGNERQMAEGAMLMIHNPWTLALGDVNEMRRQAALLEQIGDQIAGIYARRSDLDVAQAKAAMDAETWYTAEDAVAAGMATASLETLPVAAFTVPTELGYAHAPAACMTSWRQRLKPTARQAMAESATVAARQRKLDLLRAELSLA